MTQNQLAYWKLKEDIRSHKRNENIDIHKAKAAEKQAQAAEQNALTNQYIASFEKPKYNLERATNIGNFLNNSVFGPKGLGAIASLFA